MHSAVYPLLTVGWQEALVWMPIWYSNIDNAPINDIKRNIPYLPCWLMGLMTKKTTILTNVRYTVDMNTTYSIATTYLLATT